VPSAAKTTDRKGKRSSMSAERWTRRRCGWWCSTVSRTREVALKVIDKSKPVMVTGATGYMASWIVKQLLEEGISVNATVRDPSNAEKVAHLTALAATSPGELRSFKADLLDPGSFDEPMQGCELVIHTASPFFLAKPKDPEQELIRPAKEGTRNVLEAALLEDRQGDRGLRQEVRRAPVGSLDRGARVAPHRRPGQAEALGAPRPLARGHAGCDRASGRDVAHDLDPRYVLPLKEFANLRVDLPVLHLRDVVIPFGKQPEPDVREVLVEAGY